MRLYRVVDYLRTLNLSATSRLYADAGTNLILRFYTGLPFQNIMPVRKSFIDRYPGELLILESPKYDRFGWRKVQLAAGDAGQVLSDIQARRLALSVPAALLGSELRARVATVSPPSEPAPDYISALLPELRRRTSEVVAMDVKRSGSPVFDGYEIADYTKMWQVFFYRFVDPESRVGAHLNYADRIRNASARVLAGGWVILRSPDPAEDD